MNKNKTHGVTDRLTETFDIIEVKFETTALSVHNEGAVSSQHTLVDVVHM